MTVSALYAGAVIHQRVRPVRHRLRYRMFNMLLDLDEVSALARRCRLFSFNRFNLFAFHEADHGDGAAGGLRAWVERQKLAAGLAAGGAIRVLCMPRILGHAFNPISVFYCHDVDGKLVAMIYEVNNTFGERHSYVMPVAGADGPVRQGCDKQFYVSPFMPMDLSYRFRVTRPGEDISLAINASDADGLMIATAFTGKRQGFTDGVLIRRFLAMPFLGAKIVLGIHWEAFRLWCRGLRLLPKPLPPSHPVTITH